MTNAFRVLLVALLITAVAATSGTHDFDLMLEGDHQHHVTAHTNITVHSLEPNGPLCRLTFLGRVIETCALGKNGVSVNKKEGDGCSPAGAFPLRRAFYRRDRLGTDIKFPALQTNETQVFFPLCCHAFRALFLAITSSLITNFSFSGVFFFFF